MAKCGHETPARASGISPADRAPASDSASGQNSGMWPDQTWLEPRRSFSIIGREPYPADFAPTPMSRLLASLARLGAVALALGFLGWYVLRAQQQAAPPTPTQAAERTFLSSSKSLAPLVVQPPPELTLPASSISLSNSPPAAMPLTAVQLSSASVTLTASPSLAPATPGQRPPTIFLSGSKTAIVSPPNFELPKPDLVPPPPAKPAAPPPLMLSGSKTFVPVVPATPAKPTQTPSQSPPQTFLPSSKTGIISPISPSKLLELQLPKPELAPPPPAQPAAP
jgi:hypothetical protein